MCSTSRTFRWAHVGKEPLVVQPRGPGAPAERIGQRFAGSLTGGQVERHGVALGPPI